MLKCVFSFSTRCCEGPRNYRLVALAVAFSDISWEVSLTKTQVCYAVFDTENLFS